MNYKFKPSHIVPAYLFIVAVLYGGSKPPSSTNEPPDDISSPTNAPTMLGLGLRPRSTMECSNLHCTTTTSDYTSISNWTARGAYCDWLRVDFPPSFAFPSGTNLLTGVTLMAYGRLVLGSSPSRTKECSNLLCTTTTSDYDYSLPTRVSLEPDASSLSYGLTASNSFLFSWSNVCVNRDATNRVDASIELFRNGACSVRFDTVETFYPALPPPGFVGQGQDAAWLAANFSPTDYAAITNKGYARWLDEDYVGYNEENGHCRGTVTVYAMPPNGQPCYLVCGPHKVIVTEPGNYDFPVEVLTDIHIQTYPTSVPVSFSYDEGYYPDEDDYDALLMSPPNQSNNPPLLGSPQPPTEIFACIIPSLHLTPSYISFSEMVNRHVRIWCNMTQAAWEYVTLGAEEATVRFHNRHDAEVLDYRSTQLAQILIYNRTHPEVYGYLHIIPPYIPENNQNPTNDCDNGSSPTNAPPSGT